MLCLLSRSVLHLLQAASAAPPSGTLPAENGASKRKGKASGAFVLGRGSALFRSLVERAAAGARSEADDEADIAARSDMTLMTPASARNPKPAHLSAKGWQNCIQQSVTPLLRRVAALSTAETAADARKEALERVCSAVSPESPALATFLAAQRAVLEANQASESTPPSSRFLASCSSFRGLRQPRSAAVSAWAPSSRPAAELHNRAPLLAHRWNHVRRCGGSQRLQRAPGTCCLIRCGSAT